MLILTRRVDESIAIGDDIIVRVIDIDNGQVRLGIDAPQRVRILRSELLDQIRDENAQALAEAARLTALQATLAGFGRRPATSPTAASDVDPTGSASSDEPD